MAIGETGVPEGWSALGSTRCNIAYAYPREVRALSPHARGSSPRLVPTVTGDGVVEVHLRDQSSCHPERSEGSHGNREQCTD